MRARRDRFLEPVAQHLHEACLGRVSEIFDGDAPHQPEGCFAQAWGVAETLRAWHVLTNAINADRRDRPANEAPSRRRPQTTPELRPS